MVVAAFCALSMPAGDADVTTRHGLESNDTAESPDSTQATVGAPRRKDPATPAQHGEAMLSAEEHSVARFLSTRNRLTIERARQFVRYATETATEMRIDPWLILAVMSVESSFDPDAVSSVGAHGLMQVHTRVHADKFIPYGGVGQAFDPRVNIRVGAQILRDYLSIHGSAAGALKAYVGAALLPNDRGYGAKVMNEREQLAAIAAGRGSVPERAIADDGATTSRRGGAMASIQIRALPARAAQEDARLLGSRFDGAAFAPEANEALVAVPQAVPADRIHQFSATELRH